MSFGFLLSLGLDKIVKIVIRVIAKSKIELRSGFGALELCRFWARICPDFKILVILLSSV